MQTRASQGQRRGMANIQGAALPGASPPSAASPFPPGGPSPPPPSRSRPHKESEFADSQRLNKNRAPGHLRPPLLLLLFAALFLLGKSPSTPISTSSAESLRLLLQLLLLSPCALVDGLPLASVGPHQLLMADLQELEGLLGLAPKTASKAEAVYYSQNSLAASSALPASGCPFLSGWKSSRCRFSFPFKVCITGSDGSMDRLLVGAGISKKAHISSRLILTLKV